MILIWERYWAVLSLKVSMCQRLSPVVNMNEATVIWRHRI